ncbi:TPA: hypothetical protein N0F65_012692 [Lagenidium giganteum]|uniref:Cilia- and flagella-associated protein 45 n=1 Tax=Lagenidium giganteum TaxID=4803 RepID=A0AAV2YBG9_9STRA|nr:TPA: hypothetical protein N0F65_012692 [Lagenidium giganteum]
MTAPNGRNGGGTSAESSRANANRMAGKDIAGVSMKTVDVNDLERIKKRAVIMTDDDIKQIKQEQEQQMRATRHESQERKRRMMEKEKAVRARREQTAMEMEVDAEKRAVLTSEDVLRNQHLTSIRRVQSLALQASGYLACDALKERQKERQEMEDRYNRVHDAIMEHERVTELDRRKEAEAQAHAKRMEARTMLEKQIAERQKKAIWEEEAKAIEAQKILQTYKQFEAEEMRKQEQQREKLRKISNQVAQTNDNIKKMKEAQLQREKDEELVAAAYLRKKAKEEDAKLQEEMRIRKSKELRVAKLRAQQEKAQDKRAMQDEFRAKTAWEEMERNMRHKEKQDRESKELLMNSIIQQRKQQEAFQLQQKRHQQQMDAQLDMITQKHTEEEHARHQALLDAAKERAMEHGQQIREQIEGNQARREKEKMFAQNDAKFGKKKAMKESILAEKVRVNTLQRLEKTGVPEEYLRELRRMNINESNA